MKNEQKHKYLLKNFKKKIEGFADLAGLADLAGQSRVDPRPASQKTGLAGLVTPRVCSKFIHLLYIQIINR